MRLAERARQGAPSHGCEGSASRRAEGSPPWTRRLCACWSTARFALSPRCPLRGLARGMPLRLSR